MGIVLAISVLAAISINSISLENTYLQASATSKTTTQPVSPTVVGTMPNPTSNTMNGVITSKSIPDPTVNDTSLKVTPVISGS